MIATVYPIPLHIECKATTGKLRQAQLEEIERIKRSGSIFVIVRSPAEVHELFQSFGYSKMKMDFSQTERERPYKEKEVQEFLKSYLKMIEKLYGVLWYYNMQNIGSRKGRLDFYVEVRNVA